MNTTKSFVSIEGELVSVTTQFVYPPIPVRTSDYCARYTSDERDQPDYGWGATPEAAIKDLTDNYDPEDKP